MATWYQAIQDSWATLKLFTFGTCFMVQTVRRTCGPASLWARIERKDLRTFGDLFTERFWLRISGPPIHSIRVQFTFGLGRSVQVGWPKTLKVLKFRGLDFFPLNYGLAETSRGSGTWCVSTRRFGLHFISLLATPEALATDLVSFGI